MSNDGLLLFFAAAFIAGVMKALHQGAGVLPDDR